jgi:hypothetical protein
MAMVESLLPPRQSMRIAGPSGNLIVMPGAACLSTEHTSYAPIHVVVKPSGIPPIHIDEEAGCENDHESQQRSSPYCGVNHVVGIEMFAFGWIESEQVVQL